MPATILVRAVGVSGGRPGNPLQRGRLNSVNYHFVTGAALKIVDSTARQTLWGRGRWRRARNVGVAGTKLAPLADSKICKCFSRINRSATSARLVLNAKR